MPPGPQWLCLWSAPSYVQHTAISKQFVGSCANTVVYFYPGPRCKFNFLFVQYSTSEKRKYTKLLQYQAIYQIKSRKSDKILWGPLQRPFIGLRYESKSSRMEVSSVQLRCGVDLAFSPKETCHFLLTS